MTEEKQRHARISRLCRMAGNIAAGLTSRSDFAYKDEADFISSIAKTAVDIALLIEDKVKAVVK